MNFNSSLHTTLSQNELGLSTYFLLMKASFLDSPEKLKVFCCSCIASIFVDHILNRLWMHALSCVILPDRNVVFICLNYYMHTRWRFVNNSANSTCSFPFKNKSKIIFRVSNIISRPRPILTLPFHVGHKIEILLQLDLEEVKGVTKSNIKS